MVRKYWVLLLLLVGCCPPTPTCEDVTTVDVDGIAARMAIPVVAEPVVVDPPKEEPKYRVVMYSATWCRPCQTWKANEKSKIKTELVIEEYKRNGPSHIKIFPTFVVMKVEGASTTEMKRFEGYTAASKINAEIP